MKNNKPSFYWLEPDLTDEAGHFYTTCKSVSLSLKENNAFRNIKLLVSANCSKKIRRELGAEIVFQDKPVVRKSTCGVLLHDIQYALYIFSGLRQTRKTDIQKNDIIYFNTALWTHLAAILIFRCIYGNRFRFCATMRLSNYFDGKPSKRALFYKFVITILRLTNTKILFVTDSELLKSEYEQEYGISASVLPIPHLPEYKDVDNEGKIIISALGPARRYKGSHLFLDALKILEGHNFPNKDKLEIIFHIFGEMQDELKAELAQLSNVNIQAIDKPRESVDYCMDLNRSDIICIVYDERIYAKNTSGVFFEACALNKIPLITKNTWPSFINDKYRSGIEVEYDSRAIAEVIKHFVQNDISQVKADLRPGQEDFCAWHGVKNFSDSLSRLFIDV